MDINFFYAKNAIMLVLISRNTIFLVLISRNFCLFSDSTLTNDLVVTAPTNQVLDHHHGEGLLQLEPPLTSSEYSFTLDEQDNLNDLFDNLPF